MALTSNSDLTNLITKFEILKSEVVSLQDKTHKVLELEDENWENVRKKRDYLLKSTDWTVTPGATVDQAQWSAYRQNLRDLPQTYKGKAPNDVVWPVQPSTDGPNT
jgi:thioesterase domain-containing protein